MFPKIIDHIKSMTFMDY